MDDNIARQLLPNEKVLWKGHPGTGLIFRPMEFFLIPFSLLWGGFAIFWNLGVWTEIPNNGGMQFKLFGLPFIVAGIYITVGRFLLDVQIRKRLVYMVTDRRVLILRRAGSSASKTVDIKRLPTLEFDERSDGTGTIRFGASAYWFAGNNFGIWQPTFDPTPQFIRIEHARSVYDLICKQAG